MLEVDYGKEKMVIVLGRAACSMFIERLWQPEAVKRFIICREAGSCSNREVCRKPNKFG